MQVVLEDHRRKTEKLTVVDNAPLTGRIRREAERLCGDSDG